MTNKTENCNPVEEHNPEYLVIPTDKPGVENGTRRAEKDGETGKFKISKKERRALPLELLGGITERDEDGKEKWVTKTELKKSRGIAIPSPSLNYNTDPKKRSRADDERMALANEVVMPYFDKTQAVWNELDPAFRAINTKLFDVVKEAYLGLKVNESHLRHYKRLLVDLGGIDRSTVNKIIKIVSNDTIMKNLKKLPTSWGSLCLLTSVEEDMLLSWIKSKKVNAESSQPAIKKIKQEYRDKLSGKTPKSYDSEESDDELYPNFMTVDFDELDLNEKDRLKVESLLVELADYGFEIDGIDTIEEMVA